ncbi:Calsenilin [Fragariocoptes setiger]|uniref:Calsenilin n=1 Tax=Fragariocoptes setiger TaxID=1670756 RepID=A0ABQ7S8P0_9ACAR|nr:Calsenilin [Fragariocoptes setiger]
MYRGFKQLCPSGVVKEDKFKLIYAQFFPRGADTNQYARFVFNTFDVQNKQEITFTDFVIGLSVLTRGTIEDKLRWIFTLYDINGDGVITKDELFKVVSSIYDLLGKSSANLTSTVQQQQQQQQQRHSSHSWFGGLHHLSYHSHHHHHHNVPSQTSKHRSGSHVDTAAPTGQDLQGQGLDGSSNPTAGAREQTERLLRKFDLNQDGVITLDEFLESCHQDDNITKSISVFNTIL